MTHNSYIDSLDLDNFNKEDYRNLKENTRYIFSAKGYDKHEVTIWEHFNNTQEDSLLEIDSTRDWSV